MASTYERMYGSSTLGVIGEVLLQSFGLGVGVVQLVVTGLLLDFADLLEAGLHRLQLVLQHYFLNIRIVTLFYSSIFFFFSLSSLVYSYTTPL